RTPRLKPSPKQITRRKSASLNRMLPLPRILLPITIPPKNTRRIRIAVAIAVGEASLAETVAVIADAAAALAVVVDGVVAGAHREGATFLRPNMRLLKVATSAPTTRAAMIYVAMIRVDTTSAVSNLAASSLVTIAVRKAPV